jgi:hypothetical protein
MRHAPCAAAVLLAGAQALSASNLDVRIESGGQAAVKVGPGATVPYDVVGELSDNVNEGLAMFSLDLAFTGGPLLPANPPSASPMLSFDKPDGVTNPAGFGGTASSGVLLQVGGAQNTINNFLAPYPIGAVATGVAQNGSPEVLVSGSLTTPYRVGTYTLSPADVMANAIRQGETGPPDTPFWRVDAAGAGTLTPLSVTVEALTPAAPTVIVNQTVALQLDAGPANAGRHYRVLGSVTPGANPRLIVPLQNDWYYQLTVTTPNSRILQNSSGVLNASGQATALFTPTRPFAGLTAFHAFYVNGTTIFVSNAASVQVTSSTIPKPSFVRK